MYKIDKSKNIKLMSNDGYEKKTLKKNNIKDIVHY